MIDEEEYFAKIATYKLLAKHEVGQNFLVDKDVSKKIVNELKIEKDERALEIGSGAGSLSLFLSETEGDIDLIDIDEGLVVKLQNDFSEKENIHPMMGNAMRFDMNPYDKIIGNLPYYITSGILEKVLLGASNVELAVFMVQKEAFLRLAAEKGSKEYGPLQILIKYRAKMNRLFNVNRNSFAPAPHVDSTVFSLEFNKGVDLTFANKLYSFVSSMFLHRRKTILNNLNSYTKDSEKSKNILQKVNISLTARPESLSLDEYLRLVELV